MSIETKYSNLNSQMNSTKDVRSPRGKLPCPWSCVHCVNWHWHARREALHTFRSELAETLTLKQQAITLACNNLIQQHWFHSLPFQQFQALLTLFSKSFSPFPHGTCLLSVLNQYLAWDEIYHPICAPIPRNVTLRTYTVHRGLQMVNRNLTLTDTLFQETYICASIGNTSRGYNSRPKTQISKLS